MKFEDLIRRRALKKGAKKHRTLVSVNGRTPPMDSAFTRFDGIFLFHWTLSLRACTGYHRHGPLSRLFPLFSPGFIRVAPFFSARPGLTPFPRRDIVLEPCRCGGMVDTRDLKSLAGNRVPVRVRSPALKTAPPPGGAVFSPAIPTSNRPPATGAQRPWASPVPEGDSSPLASPAGMRWFIYFRCLNNNAV